MDDFCKAAEQATLVMRDLFAQTPLQNNAYLSHKFGAEIYLKREDLSPVRSYKIRGAMNAMQKALETDTNMRLFACASAGNHAQGVAFACKHFGVQGKIFMPVTTPKQKILKTQVFGGDAIEIVLEGDYFDETLIAAQNFATQNGAKFLPPFDDVDVIEGQASVGVELLEQLGRIPPDIIITPVGGGGLSSALVKYFSQLNAKTEFWFAEPCGARSLHSALNSGKLVTLDRVDNFVDGAAVARIGDANFETLQHIDPMRVLGIPEDRLCTSIQELLNIEGIVLEPAGALAIDALKDLKNEIKGKRVVCIASGGNFDFERLPDIKERALRFEGLKKYFILRMPQRPGALKDFLALLGPNDDIARFEYLKKSARNFGSVLLGIETRSSDGFDALCKRMDDEGFTYQDITNDEILAQFLI
ncbi:threonine dehydratase [Amylibacter kogurei]|uniref:L-threonine dehydratase n=1 Tax=Paramylibacter kogurei TaxID=1889778 RepID=A0A2G5KCB3_9RHOB|nr:threonine ammonia-lyase IlvA [Amylibacter kogurei]PIB26490.1 threonine dehydratase [Amylibacter kogurei]